MDNELKVVCPRNACLTVMIERIDVAAEEMDNIRARVKRLREFDGSQADQVLAMVSRIEIELASARHELDCML